MDQNARQPYVDTAKLMSENPNYPLAPEPSFKSNASIDKAPVEDLTGKFDGFGRSFVALQSSMIQEKSKFWDAILHVQ